jgi:hypothetical protein
MCARIYFIELKYSQLKIKHLNDTPPTKAVGGRIYSGVFDKDVKVPVKVMRRSSLVPLLPKIRLIKFLSGSNTFGSLWEWVKGHAVKHKGWRNCTLPKRLNDQADKLAKDALIFAISGGSTIEGDLPFKVVKFSLSGN